jgi:hypothetical protein
MTVSITMLCQYAECRILFFIVLNAIMLNVIMLNVIMVSVNMLSVVTLNVIMMNVIMLNVIMLNVIMLKSSHHIRGSRKLMGENFKSGLGRVFNFKLGCFVLRSVLHGIHTHPHSELKQGILKGEVSLYH